jgi:hypothetical protein
MKNHLPDQDDDPEKPRHISASLHWIQLELWEQATMNRLAESKRRHPSAGLMSPDGTDGPWVVRGGSVINQAGG